MKFIKFSPTNIASLDKAIRFEAPKFYYPRKIEIVVMNPEDFKVTARELDFLRAPILRGEFGTEFFGVRVIESPNIEPGTIEIY